MNKCNHIFLISKRYNDGYENKCYYDGICVFCGKIETFTKSEMQNIKYIKKNKQINSLLSFILFMRKEQEEYFKKEQEMSEILLKQSLQKVNAENNL